MSNSPASLDVFLHHSWNDRGHDDGGRWSASGRRQSPKCSLAFLLARAEDHTHLFVASERWHNELDADSFDVDLPCPPDASYRWPESIEPVRTLCDYAQFLNGIDRPQPS